MRVESRLPAYKDVTLRQLRSFCETARLGSLKAAAQSMGLAPPTLWAQLHALERELQTKLVETSSKGCRLTPAGELLEGLVRHPVEEIASLKRRFQEALGQLEVHLTVATTPRIMIEDLSRCVLEFEQRHPQVRLTLKEMGVQEVAAAVESGGAGVGLSVDVWPAPRSPQLLFEPCYDLDVRLVTPKNHPLARRRRVGPRDLRRFPLVNSPNGIPDARAKALLDKLGVFDKPRRVEAFYTAAIRKYVELGFGIGLIAVLSSSPPDPHLHERPMSRYFGRLPVYLIWRRRAQPQEPAGAFAETIKTMLASRK